MLTGTRHQFEILIAAAARLIALSVLLSVTGCGANGDGVSIGTGQDADPVIVDFPIAYIRAPVPTNGDGAFQQRDLREQITFDFGADLYFRDRAAPGASESARGVRADAGRGCVRRS